MNQATKDNFEVKEMHFSRAELYKWQDHGKGRVINMKKTPVMKSYEQPWVALIGTATLDTILVNGLLSLITQKNKVH